MDFLELKNVHKEYKSFRALHESSLSVAKSEFVCFLGPSGCGKTTLLNTISGIAEASGGSVFLDGRDITHIKPEERHCGVVFQNYALFPNLTAGKNIAYGLHGLSAQEKQHRVAEMLEMVGLSDAEKRYPAELSGGQQQRIALARALAPRPRLLLLDEPLSALDARIRTQLATELRHLQKKVGITTIMVTHDQQEAMSIADRIVLMRDGRFEQVGSPQELYGRPASHFVASFIGDMNFLTLPTGEEVAIRYEDVFIREATELRLAEENTWTARVESVQYLGRSLRLELLLQDYSTRIYADIVPQQEVFPQGALVALTLPRNKWHTWSKD